MPAQVDSYLADHRAAVHDARQSVELWCIQDIEERRELAAALRAVLRQLEHVIDGQATGEAARELLKRYEGMLVMHGGQAVLSALIKLSCGAQRLVLT